MMGVTSLILCVTFNLLTVEVLTLNFKAVTSSNGEKLCAVDKPSSMTLNVPSVIQCGAICMEDTLCETYSFKKDLEECDLYDCTTAHNYSAKPGCSSFTLQVSRPPIRDCSDIQRSGRNVSGVNTVCVNGSAVQVYCDMQTDGGGWLVFQRRMDGSVDFYRGWIDYASGFGSPAGAFWLGNNNINLLTSVKRYQLRIDMSKMDGTTRYAQYDNFIVNAAVDNYRLASLGNFRGTAGDSLTPYHLGESFKTRDKNNEQPSAQNNCAVEYLGAWWYGSPPEHCHLSNLNGYYYGGPHTSFADGVEWFTWTDYYYSLKTTEMKIRPV